MTITALSTQPNSITRPDTFNTDSDTFHSELPTLITEMNALAAAMNTIASGGLAIPYTFSTTITDADPGAHYLRLSSATQDASTAIRLSVTDAQDSDRTNQIALFDDSTSTVKGHLLLMDAADATKFIFFSVSALSALGSPPLAYHNITVTKVQSSAASPFANNASLLLAFTRNGDKGDTGAAGAAGAALVLGTPVATTSGTFVDITGIPSTAKEINVMLVGVSTSGTDRLIIQLGDAGGIETTGYTGTVGEIINAGTAATVAMPSTGFQICRAASSNANHFDGKLTITMENSSTNNWTCSSVMAGTDTVNVATLAGNKATSAVLTQIRLTTLSGSDTFDAGEMNVSYL